MSLGHGAMSLPCILGKLDLVFVSSFFAFPVPSVECIKVTLSHWITSVGWC